MSTLYTLCSGTGSKKLFYFLSPLLSISVLFYVSTFLFLLFSISSFFLSVQPLFSFPSHFNFFSLLFPSPPSTWFNFLCWNFQWNTIASFLLLATLSLYIGQSGWLCVYLSHLQMSVCLFVCLSVGLSRSVCLYRFRSNLRLVYGLSSIYGNSFHMTSLWTFLSHFDPQNVGENKRKKKIVKKGFWSTLQWKETGIIENMEKTYFQWYNQTIFIYDIDKSLT